MFSPATDMGADICERLIPLVDHLRRSIPLKLSTVFPNSLLEDIGLKADINCHDLEASDAFFDTFGKK
jgi:hypothetical protein